MPSGWLITAAHFVAFPDQDPTNAFTGPVVAGSDATSPYSLTLSGLPASTPCAVFGFFEYERADGRTAYSVSLSDIETSGA